VEAGAMDFSARHAPAPGSVACLLGCFWLAVRGEQSPVWAVGVDWVMLDFRALRLFRSPRGRTSALQPLTCGSICRL